MTSYLILLQVFIDIFFVAIIWLLLSEVNKLGKEIVTIYHIINDWSSTLLRIRETEVKNDKDNTGDRSS